MATIPEFSPEQLLTATRRNLPPEWLDNLKRAVLQVEPDEIMALAEELGQNEPELAEALIYYVDNFQYEKVLALLRDAES